MKITNIQSSIDLFQYRVRYGGDFNLVAERLDNGSTKEIARLDSRPTFLSFTEIDGVPHLQTGEGVASGQTFDRVYQPRAEVTALEVRSGGNVLGIGDWRELRVRLEYDLSQVCLAIHSDHVWLTITCPGDPEKGPLAWFEENEGN